MSILPTPPGTAHRDKENRFVSGSRVVWSQHNQYHCLANIQPLQPASASKYLPSKSILKKPSHPLLTIPDDNKRETTPEPSDPLTDHKYLEYPVSRIISPDSSLRDLIEAYSVLAARVKSSVTVATVADSSWPLFHPLRLHTDAVVDALVRDIGRATVDPGTGTAEPEEPWEEKISLPSPKQSPRKKKGMTAEQVKYARDLCTTSHAVMKLLAVIFTLPAVYRVFSDEQLRSVLTAVLAIPLASELPTPNARKTYALSIWLLQAQRLPSEILVPAKDRIAYALRRGVEGELGKEGKKGSASDGLKAIHDLCIYQPATFIPAFTELLPSIFSNLLAQTLTLRAQACHALGGFVLGCTSLPSSYVHTRVSAAVASFITITVPDETISMSPSKRSQDPVIIRTLRTTLAATDPQHVAQGPVWALSVIASFIVLLGPALCTDIKLTRIISALLSLSMRHKKSSVRAIGCLVWRCVAWVYVQPPLVQAAGESEVDDDENDDETKCQEQIPVRESYWKILKSVVDMGAGVSTVAALLSNDTGDDNGLRRAMTLIKLMIKRGGQTRCDAIEMVRYFVTCNASAISWDSNKLLPPGLFSSSPGLLTVDYSSLVSVVKPIFNQCPQFDDVRSLTREELAKTWVLNELVEIWKEVLSSVETPEELDTSSEIISIWDGLFKANVAELQEVGNDNEISQFALRAVHILVDILQDANLDLTIKAGLPPIPPTSPIKKLKSSLPSSTISPSSSNAAIKISVTRKLWSVIRNSLPRKLLNAAGEMLLEVLVHNEDELVWELDSPDEARKEWSLLCAEALMICDIDELKAFWGECVYGKRLQRWAWTPDVRNMVWTSFVQAWLESNTGSWEGAVALLAIPFADATAWDLSNEDFDLWDKFLRQTMAKALDYGVDSVSVLDQIASTISSKHCPTLESSARVADMLMTHLEITDARQVPVFVFEFVNDTLQSSYPPEPRNTIQSLWTLRSLTQVFHTCPNELALNLLETVQDGMSTWISDEYKILSQEEYTYDILPMYQIALLSIKTCPVTIDTLNAISPRLESAFCGRLDKPAAISEAFIEFWQSTYSRMEPLTHEWPVAIQHCLQAAFCLPAVAAGVRDQVIDGRAHDVCYDTLDDPNAGVDERSVSQGNIRGDDEELGYPDSDYEQEMHSELPFLFNLPRNPSLKLSTHSTPKVVETRGKESSNTVFLSQLPAAFNAPKLPSTPPRTFSSLPITSPPRPHKPSTVFPSFPLSPRSPTAVPLNPSVTPTRTPMGQLGNGGSPRASNKRRRLDNKENMSPHPVIASVAEPIAMTSPESSVLGKRRVSGQLPGEEATKKGKFLTSLMQTVSVDYEQEPELVEVASTTKLPSLLAKDLFSLEADIVLSETRCGSSTVSEKKRKRIFMDAVEVPTWQEVKTRNKSRTTSLNARSFTTARNQALRRSQSVITLAEYAVSQSPYKKRRRERASSASAKGLLSSPLNDLAKIAGSDDSIMQPSSPSQPPSELSSDDDPWHVGQVTPHHLISPALRRVQQDDYDPPSDDSNLSVSPSRDLVARRQQRLLL